jgi:fido (protein-threonine AMPylation protein)
MHPSDCPPWEYDNHPNKNQELPIRSQEVLTELAQGHLDTIENAVDSRQIHQKLFLQLVPPGYEYYAGHYRGEMFRCLRYCQVRIRSDPRVGYPPMQVGTAMHQLENVIRRGLRALDSLGRTTGTTVTPVQRILYVVELASHILELFLRVHPYVNGNGHAARFIVWVILWRYGYWPKHWPLEPRPNPPYIDVIRMYRDGQRDPLRAYILQTLI